MPVLRIPERDFLFTGSSPLRRVPFLRTGQLPLLAHPVPIKGIRRRFKKAGRRVSTVGLGSIPWFFVDPVNQPPPIGPLRDLTAGKKVEGIQSGTGGRSRDKIDEQLFNSGTTNPVPGWAPLAFHPRWYCLTSRETVGERHSRT